ncbi:uncharacterized protein [Eurosta solidaginis]|uniref:uncharacterized protein n=1 Tax=Eurosta solidaginis TaxID=178769 RepID=UPI003530C44F
MTTKMKHSQYALHLSLLLCFMSIQTTYTTPIDEVDTTNFKTQTTAGITNQPKNHQPKKLVVITEDVIPDAENTTQKVIRVNPLDLPAISSDGTVNNEDSSLYKIQSLMPPNRRYVNSNHMRSTNKRTKDSVPSIELDSPIIRQVTVPKFRKPGSNKKQHLQFIYNQNALNGQDVTKAMRVHVAPGAYPVYYVLSKINGRFGKHPIKSFRTPTEFLKYLSKNKVAPLQ